MDLANIMLFLNNILYNELKLNQKDSMAGIEEYSSEGTFVCVNG
jgi:hypothetical protein